MIQATHGLNHRQQRACCLLLAAGDEPQRPLPHQTPCLPLILPLSPGPCNLLTGGHAAAQTPEGNAEFRRSLQCEL